MMDSPPKWYKILLPPKCQSIGIVIQYCEYFNLSYIKTSIIEGLVDVILDVDFATPHTKVVYTGSRIAP